MITSTYSLPCEPSPSGLFLMAFVPGRSERDGWVGQTVLSGPSLQEGDRRYLDLETWPVPPVGTSLGANRALPIRRCPEDIAEGDAIIVVDHYKDGPDEVRYGEVLMVGRASRGSGDGWSVHVRLTDEENVPFAWRHAS